MKLIFSKNFDDFDDYKEIEVDEERFDPMNIGRIINKEQQFNWILALDEYDLSDKVFLLACKQEFTIAMIQKSLDKLVDDLNNLKKQ